MSSNLCGVAADVYEQASNNRRQVKECIVLMFQLSGRMALCGDTSRAMLDFLGNLKNPR